MKKLIKVKVALVFTTFTAFLIFPFSTKAQPCSPDQNLLGGGNIGAVAHAGVTWYQSPNRGSLFYSVDQGLGPSWSTTFITTASPSMVVIHSPGNQLAFSWNGSRYVATDKADGSYVTKSGANLIWIFPNDAKITLAPFSSGAYYLPIIISDPAGLNKVTYAWHANGTLDSITDPYGRVMRFHYNGGSLSKVTGPLTTDETLVVSTKLGFDITYPSKAMASYKYTEGVPYQVAEITDPLGGKSYYNYNSDGSTRNIIESGKFYKLTYNSNSVKIEVGRFSYTIAYQQSSGPSPAAACLPSEVSLNGRRMASVSYSYIGGADRVTEIWSATSGRQKFEYDSLGRPIKGSAGNRAIQVAYNSYGFPSEIKELINGAIASRDVYTYHSTLGKELKSYNHYQAGSTTASYTVTTGVTSQGLISSANETLRSYQTVSYDGQSRVASQQSSAASGGPGTKTTYAYSSSSGSGGSSGGGDRSVTASTDVGGSNVDTVTTTTTATAPGKVKTTTEGNNFTIRTYDELIGSQNKAITEVQSTEEGAECYLMAAARSGPICPDNSGGGCQQSLALFCTDGFMHQLVNTAKGCVSTPGDENEGPCCKCKQCCNDSSGACEGGTCSSASTPVCDLSELCS